MRSTAAAYCEMRPTFRLDQFRNARRTAGIQSWFPDSEAHLTYNGRTALRHACDLLGLRDGDVLMPSYNCGAEIEPLVRGGARIVPYRVDGEALADVDELRSLISERTKAIHVTHYFGFPQPIGEIRALCDEHGLSLIEDCALALFSGLGERKLGTWGDIAVLSLPKSLPVPNGGALVINNVRFRSYPWQKRRVARLKTAKAVLSLFRSALRRRISESPLRAAYSSFRSRPQEKELLSVSLPDDEALPDVADWMHYREYFGDRSASSLTARLLTRVDVDEIVRVRRRNYLCLQSLLTDRPGFTRLYKNLPEGVCPLGMPVICNDAGGLRSALLKRDIESAWLWTGFDRNMDWSRFNEARFLKNHLLLLPVHQGLSEKDMEYIAHTIGTLQ